MHPGLIEKRVGANAQILSARFELVMIEQDDYFDSAWVDKSAKQIIDLTHLT